LALHVGVLRRQVRQAPQAAVAHAVHQMMLEELMCFKTRSISFELLRLTTDASCRGLTWMPPQRADGSTHG
jgi:hypothetical protein